MNGQELSVTLDDKKISKEGGNNANEYVEQQNGREHCKEQGIRKAMDHQQLQCGFIVITTKILKVAHVLDNISILYESSKSVSSQKICVYPRNSCSPPYRLLSSDQRKANLLSGESVCKTQANKLASNKKKNSHRKNDCS